MLPHVMMRALGRPYLGGMHGDGNHHSAVRGQGQGLSKYCLVSSALQGAFPPGLVVGFGLLVTGYRPRPARMAAIRTRALRNQGWVNVTFIFGC